MTLRARILTASAAAAAAALLALVLVREPSPAAAPPVAGRTVGCREQSGARFPGAYRDRRNLVVGPLALIGGATFTDAATARRFGGNKYPLLLRPGHTVRVAVAPARGARANAGLSYGPHEDRSTQTDDAITFVACSARRSASRADGRVTFWSGFVSVREPACVPLDVVVDGAATPRRVRIELGRRCSRPPPLRGCADRAESGRPPDGAPLPGQVAVGPLRFAGLARLAGRRALEVDRTGGVYRVKAGVVLPAGVRATLSIGRRARGWASLDYAPRRPGERARTHGAVRFSACADDQPAFSYDGSVGPFTGFSGGFVLQHPGCMPLEARVPGRPVVRATIRFGVRRCS
jgi:hypothetical protein